MVLMAVVAQHDEVALPLEADALVRPMMDFEVSITRTQITRVASLLQRDAAHPLPMRRFVEVFRVRQPTQRGDGLLQRLVDFAEGHDRPVWSAASITPSPSRCHRVYVVGRCF